MKAKERNIRVQRPIDWNTAHVECEGDTTVIGTVGSLSRSFQKHLDNGTGKHSRMPATIR
jgi:hypothetical protein